MKDFTIRYTNFNFIRPYRKRGRSTSYYKLTTTKSIFVKKYANKIVNLIK